MTALGANPLPFTVTVKPSPPEFALAGSRKLIAGPLILKVTLPDVMPPEITVTAAVPTAATRFADTEAAS